MNFSGAQLGDIDLTDALVRDVELSLSGDDAEDSQREIPRTLAAELQIDGHSSNLHGKKF